MPHDQSSTSESERFYTVMCNSIRKPGIILARIAPPMAGRGNFWTASQPDAVWKMSRDTADEIVENLHLNAVRVVGYKKAIGIIERQAAQLTAGKLALDPEEVPPDPSEAPSI